MCLSHRYALPRLHIDDLEKAENAEFRRATRLPACFRPDAGSPLRRVRTHVIPSCARA